MTKRTIGLGATLALGLLGGCLAPDELAPLDVEQYSPDLADAPDLRHGTITTRAGEMEIDYVVVDDLAIFEGDIVVPWTDFVHDSARSATVKRDSIWPNGVVPYEIDANLPDQGRVTSAIEHWNLRTAIHLVPRTTETDYVRFVDGSGCSSMVGKVGGGQPITLASGCSTGNAIHEIGHAVGLWHEQSRADRDGFVTINWGNIQAGMSSQFDKYSSGVDVGAYDFDSVMHYGSSAFSSNGLPTITRLDGTWITGQRNALSTGDLIGVEYLYGPPMQIGRAATTGRDGTIDVFALGADHAVWHVKQTSPDGGWGGWQSLGGWVRSTPTVARNLDGHLELLVVGFNNHVYHQWQDLDGNWSGWADLGGQIAGLPIASRNLDGRLEVFGRGTDGAIWHVWQVAPNGGWSSWASFGGGLQSDPAIAINLDGRLDVFARGTDNAIWHVQQNVPNGTWGSWQSLGGGLQNSPAVGRNLDGRLELVALGTDGVLYHKWQYAPNGSWSGWYSYGVSAIGSPTLGRNLDGRLELIAVDSAGALGHLWQTAPSSGWSAWATYGGVTSTRMPDVTRHRDGRMEAFAAGVNDHALYHVGQVAPSTGWTGWSVYGGLAVIPE